LVFTCQREDRDLEVWTSEIKLRPSVRIGELVRELETNERARTDLRPTDGMQTKRGAIADAGLSKSTATVTRNSPARARVVRRNSWRRPWPR